MRLAAIAIVLLIGTPAGATALDDLLGARCETIGVISNNIELFRPDVQEAADLLGSALMIVISAFEIDPPFEEVCRANPALTVGESLRAAIKSVAK